MAEDYGLEEWQSDEAAARAEALRRIAEAASTGAEVLDFTDLIALTALPAEIAGLARLRALYAGLSRPNKGRMIRFRRNLSDIAPLASLAGLTALDLSLTQLADTTPLASLTGLTSLNLNYTRVADIAPLTSLTGLTTLDLSSTQVADITPLACLTGLTTLNLSDTLVADIAPLASLTGLTALDLSSTKVADISILLHFPAFAEERAEALSFQNTPAADRDNDRRLYMLSRLDPRQSAIETMQYLKGTHPDFRDPPGGAARRPITERLADAAPVGFDLARGQLTATNPGTPERVAPRELTLRVQALRAHLATLRTEAEAQQVSQTVKARLAAYAAPLEADEPTYVLLDGPMSFLRGGSADPFVTDGLEKGFVEGWRHLVTMHDDLRPLLLPPEEDDLPALTPEATPEAGLELADAAIDAAEAAEGPEGTDASVAAAFRAMREYFEVAKASATQRPGLVRRGMVALGGTVAKLTYLGAAGSSILVWTATAQGQAFLAKLQPILQTIVKFFAP